MMTTFKKLFGLFALTTGTIGCTQAAPCGERGECIGEDESTQDGISTVEEGDGDPGDGDSGNPGDGEPGDGDGDGDGDGTTAVPEPPQDLMLSYSQVKQFNLAWTAAVGAEHYRVLERENPDATYVQVGTDMVSTTTLSLTVPLHQRMNASYIVQACNAGGCTDSAPVDVVGSLVDAVGYVKASNTGQNDAFGWSVALSDDGRTLAVGAPYESSGAMGIGGDEADNSINWAGAVYLYTRDEAGMWAQQAYVKASNTDEDDTFGKSVALSDDGNVLAVGAPWEDSGATGIDGNQSDDSASDAGAVYLYARDQTGDWAQMAYVKASNAGEYDMFGVSLALSDDGSTLAVGAPGEASSSTGVNSEQPDDDTFADSGAAYVFARDQMGIWVQTAYVKASNTDEGDAFGGSIALDEHGTMLAVGARGEASGATGIDGDQSDNSLGSAGAVYMYVRDQTGTWMPDAYLKASNTDAEDLFGNSVALSDDGLTLAVGAYWEDSNATGIEGDQSDDSLESAGAVYMYSRSELGIWAQKAYVKASNTGEHDHFGASVMLSDDGRKLAVGAYKESGGSTGLGGDQADETSFSAGAVYMYVRGQSSYWEQTAYVKASNTNAEDFFGMSVALTGDATTLAVGARPESSGATGIGGDQADESTMGAGAVYLY
jgi:hypothetical protein